MKFCSLVLLTSLIINVSALTSVDLTISPSNPFEGDTIIFNCSVPETDSDITSWTFRKGDTVLQTGSNHQFNLTSSATLANNGDYSCEATHNSSASMNSTGQTLSVQEIFPKPTISFGSTYAFKTGDKVVISCSTIVRKENTEASYSIRNNNNEEISATNNITIDPIKTGNQGGHSCRVTANGITKDSDVKTLFVNLGLSIPTSVTVNEGSALSINCTLGGGESGASFTWTENGSPISGQTSQMLRIEKVNRNMHQSEYQCNAVLGGFNAASNTANLTVNYLDKPTIAGNTKVNEHDVLSLQCVSTGRPTITTYKWFFNGTLINNEDGQRYEKAGFERSMSGDYSCEVSNGELTQKSDNVPVMALSTTAQPSKKPTPVQIDEEENLQTISIIGGFFGGIATVLLVELIIFIAYRYSRKRNKDVDQVQTTDSNSRTQPPANYEELLAFSKENSTYTPLGKEKVESHYEV